MILTHGSNSISREANVVRIGQNDYEYTEINGLYWITKNLHERVNNVEVVYPNGNSANEVSDGLLYTAYDMFNHIVPILPTGWHIPSLNEFKSLADGNQSRTWRDYASEDLGGLNKDNLGIRLNGYRNSSGEFRAYGYEVSLWTRDPDGSSSTVTMEFDIGRSIVNANTSSSGSATIQARTAEAIRVVYTVP